MFGLTEEVLIASGAKHTAHEIYQEPAMWQKVAQLYQAHRETVTEEILKHLEKADSIVVLTGAGSSEYIGNSIVPYLRPYYGNRILSIPTTDLLSAPWYFLRADQPVLLVSFGRSGNSAESLGTIENLNRFCRDIRHLIITCNAESQMAHLSNDGTYCICLPPETHDQSFAMTSSFTSMMLLAYWLLRTPFNEDEVMGQLMMLEAGAQQFLRHDYSLVDDILEQVDFNKLVYLGSHGLKFLGEECQLKALELTQGPVATAFNSILGFRHGPKSMMTNETLTVIMLSKNEFTRQFEKDLVKEMVRDQKANKLVVLDCQDDADLRALVDYYYTFNCGQLEEVYLNYLYVLFAQVLALKLSIKRGVMPDDPCPTGEVNRVVQGVTLYYLEEAS